MSCNEEAPPPLVPLHLEPETAPAVVLVTWDTVRDDHVGQDLNPLNRTPVFDELATEGVRFMEARSVAPITLPAHASLLTGRFPSAHGARGNGGFQISTEVKTLAEELSAQQYRCGAFVSAPVLDSETGLDRGFEHFDDNIAVGSTGHVVPERDGAMTVQNAIQWIDSLPPSDPVFIWVHLFDPHRPWLPPEDLRQENGPDLYRAEIAYADRQTGQLMEALEENGRARQTLLVVAGDHGEGLGDHGESTHAWFAYDSTLRVPLLLWWGEARDLEIDRGQQIHGPASLVDVFPTLAEIEDFSPTGSDGISLFTGAQDGQLPPRALPFESLNPAMDYGTAPIFGLVDEQSRAWIDLPRRELYELNKDPGQLNNLYTHTHAEDAEALFQRFSRAWPIQTRQSLSEETRAELEALGYLQEVSVADYSRPTDPKDRIELYELLSVNNHQTTQEEALERGLQLEAEIGLQPGLVIFLVDRMDALGRHQQATATLERAVQDYPRFQNELENRRRERTEKKALVAAIRETLEAEPANMDARYDLAITLAWLEHWEEAEQLLAVIIDNKPTDAAARLQLSAIYGAMGQPEIALETLESGRIGDYSPRFDCQSARILYRYLDRKTEARSRLRSCEQAGGKLQAPDLVILSSK